MTSKSRNRFLKWEKPVFVQRYVGIESVVRQEQRAAEEAPRKTDLDNVEEVLDMAFPVKHMERDNKKWCQHVSRERPTAYDILDLSEILDSIIEQHEEDGTITYVKADIYKECMVELVRQEIIECPQRGLLMRTATDAIFSVIDYLSKLCESAFAYGITKALQTDRLRLQLEERLQKLQEEQKVINAKVEELEANLLYNQNRLESEIKKQTEDFMVEEEILEESNQLLEKRLEVRVDPRKA